MPRRETTFHAKDHAEWMPSGAAILAAGTAMDDLLHKLHHGDPTIGWDGDERLCLAFNRQTDKWELWRREYDEQYRLVCRSAKGHAFPPNLIENLVSQDGQKGYDLAKDLDRSRALADRINDKKFSEAMAPGIERLGWALRRDLDIGSRTYAIGGAK